MRHDRLAVLALIPLLAACGGSGSGTVKSAPAPQRPAAVIVRPPVHRPPPSAQVQMVPGLEGVIGASADELVRQFGPARLDDIEGDARKLQFAGTPCVMDVYLYPAARGGDPRATYVDARRSDGRDVDRAACVAALRRK